MRPGGLHDEVDVDGGTSHVRPQADIHLLGISEILNACAGFLEYTTELTGFYLCETGYVNAMPKRLDDQSPNSQGTDAMLDDPVLRLADSTSRDPISISQTTCKTVCRHPSAVDQTRDQRDRIASLKWPILRRVDA